MGAALRILVAVGLTALIGFYAALLLFYAGCAFAFFLVLAPLYKAGNRPLPLMLLELAAVGFLFVIVAVHRQPLVLPRTLLLPSDAM